MTNISISKNELRLYSLIIAAMIVVAYSNPVNVPFIFDNTINIFEKYSLRNINKIIADRLNNYGYRFQNGS
jgi:hypothetical protein